MTDVQITLSGTLGPGTYTLSLVPPPPVAPLRPFSAASPYNAPITASPVLDPNSAALVGVLAAQNCVANLNEYGVPVYVADAFTPTYLSVVGTPVGNQIGMSNPWNGNYGAGRAVPIPVGAKPAPGSDHHLVVIDPEHGLAYGFWEFSGGPPYNCGYGAVCNLAGTGYPGAVGDATTGSGIPVLAGLIRAAEVKQGYIEHALALAVKQTGTGSRYPATKSDGHGSTPPALPMGCRVQLDPAVDVAALPGLSAAERMIGVALQRYGAYVRDTAGAPFTMFFESVGDPAALTNPYHAAGLTAEYAPIRLPWSRLRVLATWDGS